MFVVLYSSAHGNILNELGNSIAPLHTVGGFLRDVAIQVGEAIDQHPTMSSLTVPIRAAPLKSRVHPMP